MKSLEIKAKALNCVNSTFRINQSLEELEKEFKESDTEPLFEFEYNIIETCFCLR